MHLKILKSVHACVIAMCKTHFWIIASKKRSDADRSVQSTDFDTANLVISAGENKVSMASGNVRRMRAIVGAMCSMMSFL